MPQVERRRKAQEAALKAGGTLPPNGISPNGHHKPPKFPPDPLDISDGWARIVGIRYAEPSPIFPDDRSKDIVKIGYFFFNTDTSGAVDIAAAIQDPLRAQEKNDLAQALAIAGERVREADMLLAERAAEAVAKEPVAAEEG